MFLKLLLTPISWIYRLIITIRHKLYDTGVFKSVEFDIPIICVGNITVGGTGKTPHIEYLIGLLSDQYNIAVLSRGYKRRSKGFLEVASSHPTKLSGDEPKQIKVKYPHIVMAVCEDRVEGVQKIRALHPEVNMILLDDGFQHRKIKPGANIVLIDYSRPIHSDKMLPLGRLRDLPGQLSRADFVIITKCPTNIRPIDMRIEVKRLNLYPFQSLFFTRILSSSPIPLFPNEAVLPLIEGQNIVVMAALANPSHFINNMKKSYNVIKTIVLDDHHIYKRRDLKTMQEALAAGGEQCVLVTTEKDAVKLIGSSKIPAEIRKRIYYNTIKVEFVDNFQNNSPDIFYDKIKRHVRQTQRNSALNPS